MAWVVCHTGVRGVGMEAGAGSPVVSRLWSASMAMSRRVGPRLVQRRSWAFWNRQTVSFPSYSSFPLSFSTQTWDLSGAIPKISL